MTDQPLPELFSEIDRTVGSYEKFLPETQRSRLHSTLLGFASVPNLPPLRKRIDQNGMLVEVPLSEEHSISVKAGNVTKFLETPIDEMKGGDAERDMVFSAIAELSVYNALAAHAVAHGARDRKVEITGRKLAEDVGELDRRIGEKLNERFKDLPPEQKETYEQYFAQMRSMLTERFAGCFSNGLPPVEQGRGVAG